MITILHLLVLALAFILGVLITSLAFDWHYQKKINEHGR